MKAREIPRKILRERIAPRVGRALERPWPSAVLHSEAARRAAQRVLRALDAVSDAAERAAVLRAAQRMLEARGRGDLVQKPLRTVREGLSKMANPKVSAAPAAEHPMPEMIKSTGGKRVPAAVANRAVKRSGGEFKVKKGKK